MKFKTGLITFSLALVLAPTVLAQDASRTVERTEKLYLELVDVHAKEVELRLRLEELTEALKPENIERALAGIGSTKPEELREHRRRLLTIERDRIAAQLKIYEETRQRLEAALATAAVVHPLRSRAIASAFDQQTNALTRGRDCSFAVSSTRHGICQC